MKSKLVIFIQVALLSCLSACGSGGGSDTEVTTAENTIEVTSVSLTVTDTAIDVGSSTSLNKTRVAHEQVYTAITALGGK